MADELPEGCGKETERALARLFLVRADEFLPSAELARIGHPGSVCHGIAIAAELALKAYLLSQGWSDDRCRRELRHDIERAMKSAQECGLPVRSKELTEALAVLNVYYPRHAFDRFVAPAGDAGFPERARARVAGLTRKVRPVVDAVSIGAPLPD